jgi:hypothetical protein
MVRRLFTKRTAAHNSSLQQRRRRWRFMLAFDMHTQGGPAPAQLTAVRVRTGRLRAHVHGHNVLAHIALPVAALGAENTGPHPPAVLNYVAGHGRVYVHPLV